MSQNSKDGLGKKIVKKAAAKYIWGALGTTVLPYMAGIAAAVVLIATIAVIAWGVIQGSWVMKTSVTLTETASSVAGWFSFSDPLTDTDGYKEALAAEKSTGIPWAIILDVAKTKKRNDYQEIATELKEAGWDKQPTEAMDKAFNLILSDVVYGAMDYVKDGKDRLQGIINGNGAVNSVSGTGEGYLLTTDSGVTAATLNRVLGGVLKGKGKSFYDSAKKWGIDPAILAAISMHETGNGTAPAARVKHNVGGMMRMGGGLQVFPTIDAGIEAMASNLRRNYVDDGLLMLSDVRDRYAPLGASNDPTGLNNYWIPGVTSYLKKMGVSAPSSTDSGGSKWLYPLPDGVGIVSELPLLVRTRANCTTYRHMGQDIAAPKGTPIYAPHSGSITTNSFQAGGAGNYIAITTEDGVYRTVYMHMAARSALKVGAKVSAGQVVGMVGNTGGSTGAHLHLEVYKNGQVGDINDYIGFPRVKPGAGIPFDKSYGRCSK